MDWGFSVSAAVNGISYELSQYRMYGRLFFEIYRFGQPIDPGTVHQQVERVKTAGQGFIRAIKKGAGFALLMQLLNTRPGADDEFAYRSKPDRIGGTGLGASGHHPLADAVIAERALPGNF